MEPKQRRHHARHLPPAVEFTAFALDQWKTAVERDGAELAILASHLVRLNGVGQFEELTRLAAARGIPVIDQAEWILRQGAQLEDAQWEHDGHWNPRGHQWAAEAVLAWLEQHRHVCLGRP